MTGERSEARSGLEVCPRLDRRYEKRGINYLAMVMLGMILLWL